MSDLKSHLSKQKVPYIKDLVRIYKLKTKVNLTQKKADLIKDLDKHLELKDKKIKLKSKGVAKITFTKEKKKKPKTTATPKKSTPKTTPKPVYDDEIKPVKKKSTPKPKPKPTPSSSRAIVPIGKVKTLIKTTMRKAKTNKNIKKMSDTNVNELNEELKKIRRKAIMLTKNIREGNQKFTDKDEDLLDDYGRTIRSLGKNSIDDKIYMELVRLRDADKSDFQKDMGKNSLMGTDLVYIVQYNALKKLGVNKTINKVKSYLNIHKDEILEDLYTDQKIKEDYKFFS